MVARLSVTLGDKPDWVKVFDPRDCTVFAASEDPPEVGAQVRLDLTIGDDGPRIILHGRVISRSVVEEEGMPPGCTLAVGFEDREKINYINGYVRGGLLNLRERRRLPIRLPVTYGGVEGPCRSYTRDINEEGIFVVTENPLPEESEVHLRVEVPGKEKPISLVGVVSHTVVIEDEDVPGMGIVFRIEGSEAEALQETIDSLETKLLDGSLPEELLL